MNGDSMLGMLGSVALVTGAAQGIGAAVAGALAEHGVRVAAVDRSADTLASTVTALRGADLAVTGYPMDVTDAAAVSRTVRAVEADLGGIDILVNVAGILHTGPLLELTDDEFAAVFGVNVAGVLHCSRAVGSRMAGRGGGVIVTVASNAALVPRRNMAVYAASKAASTMLTKCLGLELAEVGVRCNVVCPGSTDTAMQRGMWADDDGERAVIDGSLADYKPGIPLGRIATPRDIAETVLFLCSAQARHLTLQDITVDGGAALGA